MEKVPLMDNQDNVSDTQPLAQTDKSDLCYLVSLTSIAAIGGFLFGYDTGVVGGAALTLKPHFNLTDFELSLVVSIALGGAVLGALCAGRISDHYGRKTTIFFADILFITGSLILLFSQEIYELYVGRFVVGIGIGTASMIVPVYLAEISPDHRRGAIVSCNIFFVTFGQLASYLLCLAFPDWRVTLGIIAAIPPTIQAIFIWFFPESPRWQVKVGRIEEAKKGLAKILNINDQETINHSISEMSNSLTSESEAPLGDLVRDLFGRYRTLAILGCGLQFWQQFVGINTVMYYGPEIMQKAGFSSDSDAIISSIPLAAMNLAGTIVAINFIDRKGRRWILLKTLPFVVLSLGLMTLASVSIGYTPFQEFGKILSLVALMLYIASFSIGMGPTPWTVNSEIYPLHLRGVGTSAATTVNWISNFIVSLSFLPLSSTNAGNVAAWVILTACAASCFVFVYHRLPETKDRSLEEILTLFKLNGNDDGLIDKNTTVNEPKMA